MAADARRAQEVTEYHYHSPGPVGDQFLLSEAFITGLRGPVGAGKSTLCVMKLLTIARRQHVQRDGRRHSRFIVVRNTYSELKTTTIKTWHMWVPETIGKWTAQGPPTHHIIDGELDMEVIFLALDRPADVKKVLGIEITGAWINEAREVEKAIIDAISGRMRFPSKRDGGVVLPQIVMDTNSPEIGHWWQVLAEHDTSTEANQQLVESVERAEAEMRDQGLLKPKQPLFFFLAQPNANSPDAENRENLEADYYAKLSAGKSEEWIKVYVRGEYGFVQDGRPVYPEYRESQHVRVFELNPKLPISIGIDFGLTPAATIGQRTFAGVHRVHHELVTERAGAKQFALLLRQFLEERYPRIEIASITGDPAGDSDSQTNMDETCFKILKANGIDANPAHTNDPTVRRESVAQAMTRLIDGEAGYQVHKTNCPVLRRGLAGQYRYRRVQVVGTDRFHNKPEKNAVSHVCEAEQYRMLGIGEGRIVLSGQLGARRQRPAYSIM